MTCRECRRAHLILVAVFLLLQGLPEEGAVLHEELSLDVEGSPFDDHVHVRARHAVRRRCLRRHFARPGTSPTATKPDTVTRNREHADLVSLEYLIEGSGH